ncbi:MAG: phospholipid carrier-dependent glycosyltransferase [Proteobacteria bacterium]|nr:phospholipid carrier-dependent glycosyltransferase [Pseudomonadota bacterium]
MLSVRVRTLLCCSIVLVISYFTYFHNYNDPSSTYFDEHYYVINAERYIHGMVFFEANPPLGKMFIALGEKLFNPNENVDIKKQLEQGYIFLDDINGFSYIGVRFFPALFGFLNGLLIFLIFYGLSKNNFLSLMFSSLYLFENSSIVHFRGAMLDSTLVFFSFLTILYFIYLYEKKKEKTLMNYFVLGCLTGLAVFTKMVGFVLILLMLFLLFKELKKYKWDNSINKTKKLFKCSISYLLGLCVVCITVYYVQIALGSNILDSNITDGKLKNSVSGASREYAKMIKNKEIYNPLKIFIPMRDYFRHIITVQLALSKKDPYMINSNPLYWPIGIKNIGYGSDDTVEDNKRWYLNFQGNPVNWSFSLMAVLLSICLIFAKNIFKAKVSNTRTYDYIFIFTSLYIGYMAAVVLIATQRVLYIHMYLLPLFFSFILFFLIFNYIFEKCIIKKDKILYLSIFLLVAQIFYVYFYVSPVTYGESITYLECEKTKLISFWEDNCIEY